MTESDSDFDRTLLAGALPSSQPDAAIYDAEGSSVELGLELLTPLNEPACDEGEVGPGEDKVLSMPVGTVVWKRCEGDLGLLGSEALAGRAGERLSKRVR